MSTPDKQIADILSAYGEPIAGNIWRVQNQPVIYHKALERIAVQAKITFDQPVIVRAERDEAVVLVTGRMGGTAGRSEWSFGEALVNVNYKVSGRQAGYVYAMAEKRGKDRVILKLIGLHGLLLSEEEADEFRAPRQEADGGEAAPSVEPPRSEPVQDQALQAAPDRPWPAQKGPPEADEIRIKIDKAKTINAVTDLMLLPETQKSLNEMAPVIRDQVRDYAKARLMALGWPSKRAA